ncbi:MAG: hypothetical protein ABFR02_04475 [Campylobacterota bacterium]
MRTIKRAIFYIGPIITISLLQGCSGHTLQELIDADKNSREATGSKSKKVAPSQNKALSSISPSATADNEHEEYRYMQKSTNTWLKNEWEPLTEGNRTTPKKDSLETVSEDNMANSDDINSTGLQYYVDKAGLYLENREKRDANKTKAPSHVDKINAMPGIGKSAD